MIAAPEFLCSAAIGLTTLLAVRADALGTPVRDASLPTWLPLVVLAACAAASSVLGLTDPETFAAAFGVV
jgi:hypothetical protein